MAKQPPTEDAASNDDVPVVRERVLASKRACVITGLVAFGIGAWINGSAGVSVGRTLFGGAFLGAFTGYGLWLVTKVRTRVRPQIDDPLLRDPSAPPPAGGWANPTGGQTSFGALRRALSGLRLRGPRDPRR